MRQSIARYASIILLSLLMTSICHAALSKEDASLLNIINVTLSGIPNAVITVQVNNGNVAISGVAGTNNIASSIIASITAIPQVKNLNTSNLLLPNGERPNRGVIAIGLIQGRMLLSKMFGKQIITPKELPVRVTYEDNIIYLNGMVNNQNIMTRSIIIAQQTAKKLGGNMRVLSRLTVRRTTVRMP